MLRCGISKATDLLLLYERYNGLSANLNIIIRNFLASLRDKGIFVHLREISRRGSAEYLQNIQSTI